MTINHQKSAPNILKQATLVGPHAKDSILKLNFSLKANHTNKAAAVEVEGFLKAHGIQVLGVSSHVIHTRATTEFYEHALGVRLNDYSLKGQTFISSPDLVKLPASIAPYVNGVFATIPRELVHGHFSPASVAHLGKSMQATGTPRVPPVVLAPSQGTAAWATVTDYPIPISDNCAATDPLTGLVYDVGGVSNSVTVASGYVYDPNAQSWTQIADMPEALEKPACSFISGHLYVTAGWDTTGNNNQNLYIYDPSSDSWSTGASMTVSVGGGPGYATLGGKFYVIAGCADGVTCPGTTGVEVYDPSSNTWSAAADYPEAVAWGGCGGAGTVIVCAGGTTSSSTDTADAYTYDPGSNTWTAAAPVPYDIWAMGAIGTADGHFLISNGVTDGFATQTNQASIYDVASNSWSALPNNPQTTYRLAGACGFYTIGGAPFTGIPNVSLLPGYNICALTGPTGSVSGSVTATASGSAIAGAKLSFTPGNYSTVTHPDGSYTITLPTGDYTETASAFGYLPDSASVTVTEGGNTVQDFALESAPAATLGGKVTDSGHGYPLYAEVVVTNNGNTVADLWTNPRTGGYNTSLPTGQSYGITVTPYFSGYTPGSATVTLGGDTNKSFVLHPDSSCSAPGYGFEAGFGEDFDSGTFPPTGWTVTNDVSGSPTVWELTSQEPSPYNVNVTGGTGDAADADNNAVGSGQGAYDTSLITPAISTSTVGPSPTLQFLENFVPLGTSALDVDISTDGGNTWTTIDHQTTQCGGGVYTLPGCTKQYDLSSYLSGATSFQLRWRFYNADTNAWDWYAQIDDVGIGECEPVAGGIVQGRAGDRNTHQTLDGVTITDESGNSTTTTSANGRTGSFIMFEPTGDHTLTASKSNYQDAVKSVSVDNGGVVNVQFILNAAQLTVNPEHATVSVPVGTQQTYTLHIGNTGRAPVDWQLSSLNAPPAAVHKQGHGNVPLRLVPGHYSPASLMALSKQGRAANAVRPNAPAVVPHDSAWQTVADLPIPISDNCAATDTTTGKVYDVGGVSNSVTTAAGYVYDPTSNSWSSIADMPEALEKPACAFISGHLYVTAGWDTTGNNNQNLYIYDPGTDSWSTGTSMTVSVGGGPGYAAMNGEFYVIAGCADGVTCPGTTGVEVYDPSSDSWSTAADYPEAVAWNGCGAAGAVIACVGGTTSSSTDTADAYTYDPSSDSWTAVTASPYDIWAMASVGTADGQLLISNGVTDGFATQTNQAESYDVASDTWTALPNNPQTTYRLAGACGFYTIGGSPFTGIPNVSLLPGYDVCGIGAVPWLSFEPASGTLDRLSRTTSAVTIDGTGQTAGTSSIVQVRLTGNTPYGAITIPLQVNWTSAP